MSDGRREFMFEVHFDKSCLDASGAQHMQCLLGVLIRVFAGADSAADFPHVM